MRTDILTLRQQIIASLQATYGNTSPSELEAVLNQLKSNQHAWWLLGTLGCHLCAKAEQLLRQYQTVEPIDYIVLDITDFDEHLMAQFATSIPVILTPKRRINAPFSILDLQDLTFSNY